MKKAIWLSLIALAMWSVQSLGAASEESSTDGFFFLHEFANDGSSAASE